MNQNLSAVNTRQPILANIVTGSTLLRQTINQHVGNITPIVCAVSNSSDMDAMIVLFVVRIAAVNSRHFVSELGVTYTHAVAVNRRGEPLSSWQVGAAL